MVLKVDYKEQLTNIEQFTAEFNTTADAWLNEFEHELNTTIFDKVNEFRLLDTIGYAPQSYSSGYADYENDEDSIWNLWFMHIVPEILYAD